MKAEGAKFLTLARKRKLDNETAYTICKMIDSVGFALVDDWDWNWLEKRRRNYWALIDTSLLDKAWSLLARKEWFSLQRISDNDKPVSTIVQLEGMTRLRTLVLQNNSIDDIRSVASMPRLNYLSIYTNCIADLSPLRALKALEELSIGENPVTSLSVLGELSRLRDLSLSTGQVAKLAECKRLPKVQRLTINGDTSIANFADLPEMQSLKVLTVWNAKDLAGVERFTSLEALKLLDGRFSSLEPLRFLKSLTHLTISTRSQISVEALSGLCALRCLSVSAPGVRGIKCLNRLPVIHEVKVNPEEGCEAGELRRLRADLTSWDAEFGIDEKRQRPSLHVEVVDQKTFDHFDTKQPFGVHAGECNDGMLDSERRWLLEQISEALEGKFEKDRDFHLPYTSGFRRSERLVIYSIAAYESFRDIVLAVQKLLCRTRNDWIIYCQSLLDEGPLEDEIPDGTQDFIVWIYPDKIVATAENAKVVQKLIEW